MYTVTFVSTFIRRVNHSVQSVHATFFHSNQSSAFLPRCMECRRGLAMRKLAVRPYVRLSVKRVDCDKTEERSVQISIPYERPFSL